MPLPVQRKGFGIENNSPNSKRHGNWMPNYESPFFVKEAFFRKVLILTNMDEEELPQPVNANRVKKISCLKHILSIKIDTDMMCCTYVMYHVTWNNCGCYIAINVWCLWYFDMTPYET